MEIHYSENPLFFESIPSGWKEVYEKLHQKEKIRISFESKQIEFLNYAGYFQTAEKTLLIYPQKLERFFAPEDPEKEFLKFYHQILVFTLENLPASLFFELSPAGLFVEESFDSPHPLYQLLILLLKQEEILESFALIQKEPHRHLAHFFEEKPFSRAKSAKSHTLRHMVQNPQYWQPCADGILKSHDHAYTPEKILEQEAEETFNTPENRFIKHFLNQLSELCLNLQNEFKAYPALTAPLKTLLDETEFLIETGFLKEAGELKTLPSSSQVLLKKPGYRELFALSGLLFSGFVPEPLKNLEFSFKTKDLATLWEYYCLSFLCHALEPLYGKPQKPAFSYHENYETAALHFSDGLTLHYQKTFKSYSDLEWRPDFYLEHENKKLVCDAKFRFFETQKKDILQNLHYYKDGLNLHGALALCLPQTLNRPLEGTVFFKTGNPKSLNGLSDFLNETNANIGFLNLEINHHKRF